MTLFPVRNPTITLGVTDEAQTQSTRERLLKKKYMGVWNQESNRINTIIPRFPTRVIK
jgi:hypothetical protein